MMTAVWPAVRKYLPAALLVAGCLLFVWLARGSVRFGPTPPYHEPNFPKPYEAHLVAWQTGSARIAGWSRNNTFADCPSLVIWVTTGGRDGYIGAGPVAAGQPVGWSGWLQDAHGKSVPVTTAPRVRASCQ